MTRSLFDNLASSLQEHERYLDSQRQRYAQLQARYDELTIVATAVTGSSSSIDACKSGRGSSSRSLITERFTTTAIPCTTHQHQTTLASMQAQLAAEMVCSRDIIEAETRRLSEHETTLASVSQDLAALNARMAADEMELEQLDGQMEALEQDIVAVDGEVQAFRGLAGRIVKRAGRCRGEESGVEFAVRRSAVAAGGDDEATSDGDLTQANADRRPRTSAAQGDIAIELPDCASSSITVAQHKPKAVLDVDDLNLSSPPEITVRSPKPRPGYNFMVDVPLKRKQWRSGLHNDDREDAGSGSVLKRGVKRAKIFRRCMLTPSIESD